jgi:hypothetical protein
MSRKHKKRNKPAYIPPPQAVEREYKPLPVNNNEATVLQLEIARDIETLFTRFKMKVVTN